MEVEVRQGGGAVGTLSIMRRGPEIDNGPDGPSCVEFHCWGRFPCDPRACTATLPNPVFNLPDSSNLEFGN